MFLPRLTDRFRCIAIIGMEKNAGKTTVLNHLLRAETKRICAVTSIGFDGEEIDQVTGSQKPTIYVGCGTLIATADGLISSCDITRKFLKLTGIHTAMGEVVIVKALSDGFVRIAGPAITNQMEKLLEMLKECGAEKIFIDGAAARKSTAAISSADCCILATGASYSPSIGQIVSQTRFNAGLLNLPSCSDKSLIEFLHSVRQSVIGSENNDCFARLESGEFVNLGSSLDDQAAFVAAGLENISALVFSGAMSNGFAKKFLEKTRKLGGLKLVARDGTRFMLSLDQYQSFLKRGASFEVIKPGNLLAITVNPVAPTGFNLDPEELKEKLTKATDIPVFDVVADEERLDVA